MRVAVERVEPDGERSLVFGVDETGRRVAFHLPRSDGEEWQTLLDSGREILADLPDGPPAGKIDPRSHQVHGRTN